MRWSAKQTKHAWSSSWLRCWLNKHKEVEAAVCEWLLRQEPYLYHNRILNSCHDGTAASVCLMIVLQNNDPPVANSDTWHCNDLSFSRYDIGNGAQGRRIITGLFVVLLTLPAMLFHTYRPNTPAIGSTGLVVVLMTANSAVSTAVRSATARKNKQLTQIPAFMNVLSCEPATSQWCHVYRWYSVATFTWTVHCDTHCCCCLLQYLGCLF